MNFKTTISLVIVLLAVLGISWYMGVFSEKADRPAATATPTVDATKVYLIAPKLKDVVSVRLELRDKGAMTFEKKGENWVITDPVEAPALSWEVTDLVSSFEEARKVESFVPGQGSYAKFTLADAGLDQPLYTITFTEKDQKRTYLVGKNAVATENTYVKTPDGSEVVLVDQNLKGKIKKELAEYRDKKIWEINKDKISELVYENRDGRTYKFAKGSDEKWVMQSPVRAAASTEAIINAENALASLRAETFADDNPGSLGSFGLAKPAWKVTVVETEKVTPTTTPATTPAAEAKPTIKRTERVILLGNPAGLNEDQVFAKLADKKWVVTIKEPDIKAFLPDATAWRDKKILPVDKNEIAKVQIRHGGQEIVLAKSGTEWKLHAGSDALAADDKTVTALLDTLTGLEAASFIDQPDARFLQKNKLDHPAGTVTVTLANSMTPVELAIGGVTPSGMFRYVRKSGLDYLAAVSNEKLSPVFKPALAYRNKRIMEFNIDHVKSIEVVRGKDTYLLTKSGPNATWALSSPVAAAADQNSVRNLLLSLTTLEASDFVGGNPGSYGLQRPQVRITVVTEFQEVAPMPTTSSAPAATKPAREVTTVRNEHVLAASRVEGKVYAARMSGTTPLVAQISDKVFEDLNAELADRTIFTGLPTEKIDRVEIKRPGADPVVFEKTDGEWKFPADPVFVVDKAKMNDLITALAQVKASRFVDFKAAEGYGLTRPHFKITVSAGKDEWWLAAGQVSKAQNRYARSSQKPWVFDLAAEDYAKFDKALKDLAKTAEAPTPAEAMNP